MKNKLNFARLNNSEAAQLIGGFSSVFSGNFSCGDTSKINNCYGGNLVVSCGKGFKSKKSSKHIPNTNCKGNCVKGCGEKTK